MDIVVTVLTGGRPHLLEDTLASFHKHVPEATSLMWLALVNGSDQPTFDVLKKYPHIAQTSTPRMLPIGEGLSMLMNSALCSRCTHVLHLEDDWRCIGPFFTEAKKMMLAERPGQIRLRHHGERVLGQHMITKRPIKWEIARRHKLSPEAHFTFNPSLVEREVWERIVPCKSTNSEDDAQRKFLMLKRSTVQLIPGAFVHTGGGNSLAGKTGGR